MSTRPSFVVALSLVAAVSASLAFGAGVFHWYAFMGPDSGARFLMIREWGAAGPLLLHPTGHAGAARLVDPFIGYTVAVSRGVCTVYPALFPFVAGLSYFTFGPVGLVLPALAGGVVAAWLTHRAARVWELASVRWAAAIFFFGTPLVVYSSTFWDHSIQIAIVAAATLWLLRGLEGSRHALVVSGVIAGCGAWMHELVVAAGLCFAVALASRPRAMLCWLAGFVGPVGAWIVFNRVFYGVVRGPHLMGPLTPGTEIMMRHLLSVTALRDRATNELAGGHGHLERAYVMLVVVLLVLSRLGARRGALAVTAALTLGSAWLLARPGYAGGLFEVTPWLLLAYADRPSGASSRDVAHRVLLRAATLFAFVVIATPIDPGLNWGSRYLLTMSPVLALLALRNIERLATSGGKRGLVWAGVGVYALFAVFAFSRATQTYHAKRLVDGVHARTVAGIQSRVTATDRWWLGPELAPAELHTALRLVAYVPASEQLPAPLPRDPDRVVRDAFFDGLESSRVEDFSYVGGESTLTVLRGDARARGWIQVELRHEGRFCRRAVHPNDRPRAVPKTRSIAKARDSEGTATNQTSILPRREAQHAR